MIAQLKGKIVRTLDKSVVLDIGGVGYEVSVPQSLLDELNSAEEATLAIYHYVKENSNELFGFADFAARGLFEMLIGISGIGPRSALGVMSLGSEEQIRQAIATENTAYLAAAPGVGPRSAQRICSELKDKVDPLGLSADIGVDDDEALEALLSLGYSRGQAAKALHKIDRGLPSEDRVKQALKGLS